MLPIRKMRLLVPIKFSVADFAERISFAEHWKLVAEASEFYSCIDSIFSNSKYTKKLNILSEKRESGMALKKLEFTSESGNLDAYDVLNRVDNLCAVTWFILTDMLAYVRTTQCSPNYRALLRNDFAMIYSNTYTPQHDYMISYNMMSQRLKLYYDVDR